MPGLKTLESPTEVPGRITSEPFGCGTPSICWRGSPPRRTDADGKWGKWAQKRADVCSVLPFPPSTDGKQDDCATLALPVEVNRPVRPAGVLHPPTRSAEPGHDEILIDFPVGLYCCGSVVGELGSGLGNIDGKNCYRKCHDDHQGQTGRWTTLRPLLRVRRIGNLATIDVLSRQPTVDPRRVRGEARFCHVNPYIQKVPALQPRFFPEYALPGDIPRRPVASRCPARRGG